MLLLIRHFCQTYSQLITDLATESWQLRLWQLSLWPLSLRQPHMINLRHRMTCGIRYPLEIKEKIESTKSQITQIGLICAKRKPLKSCKKNLFSAHECCASGRRRKKTIDKWNLWKLEQDALYGSA